ncbi:hypothetical protein GJ744_001777 [Endocarpon pusillum]|uniref:Spermatogenesis-associated protein 20-like TRX domain-containing protein n=1 Tax=Endocarpon pusillum TaxID=364733 RepID=A0A8H7A8X7_9EURO|nr:hypothetical protein GJ744_001777 [Endocarpon pusillum]
MEATDDGLALRNDVASSSSSYVRSHEGNPVAWQQWSTASIDLAKRFNRLIFLSIGYSACHWCHVMEQESFSSSEVAEVLNENFIPIKVDREARPDIDELYMNYVTATTGSGGWPLNVFLTPELEPVFGGTYWPGPNSNSLPRLAAGSEDMLTFLDILGKMKEVWNTQQQRCIHSAKAISQQLRDFAAEGSHSDASDIDTGEPEPLDIDIMDDAFDHFMSRYDPIHGGFSSSSSAPKFPTPPNLTFLLRLGASVASTSTRFGFPSPIPSILGEGACTLAASMSLHTLLAMSRSGLRDHLGYGFHRYSVTSDWNLPHFEKMLYDNAQLLCCYCDAWALSRDPEILGTICSLVEYLTSPDSPIVHTEGGFFASEDADSASTKDAAREEKREGAFYVWTLKDIQATLHSERDANILASHYGVLANGNVPYENDLRDEFMGQNVLHTACTPSVLAKEFGLPEQEIVRIIRDGRQKLRAHRALKRGRPHVDEKILTGWNALAIAALCRASTTLGDVDGAKSENCKAAALKAAYLMRKTHYDHDTKTLKRYSSPRLSKKSESTPAYVDDYAYMTQACLALYEITFAEEWLEWADALQNHLNNHFWSPKGGFNLVSTPPSSTQNSGEEAQSAMFMNIKSGSDNALPSPNGIIASNLLLLSSYLDEAKYKKLAKQTIDAFAIEIIQHPFLYVSMLSAIVLEVVGVTSVVATGDTTVHHFRGFGRTVIRIDESQRQWWLMERNQALKGLKLGEGRTNRVMICEAGTCREMKDGELDPHGEQT